MGWIYVDDIEITDAVNSIHVDTRDFHCNLLEEKIDLRDRRHPEITRRKHNNAYMIKADKIKEWLKGLETLTGGKVTDITKGDKVLYRKYAGTEVSNEGNAYLVMKQDDVIAIVEN